MTTFLMCALAFLSFAQDNPTRVIASAKNWTITAQQFEAILGSLPPDAKELYSTPESRRRFLDDLIQMWVLADEAHSKGFDQTVERKAVVGFYSNNIVASDYKDDLTATSHPTDADVAAYYKENVLAYTEVKLSHIMILNGDSPQVKERKLEGGLPAADARKKLEEIRAKVIAGGDFAALAKEFSQDPSTANKGGDIGFLEKGSLVKEMDDAAFALKEGETSQVVESPVAFHILKLTERKLQPLADVQDDIRDKLISTQTDSLIKAKVKAAGITIDETFFKKP